jgi:large subunit ribosomal protein L17
MRRNLVSNLFLDERVRTTRAKAKEVRPLAEKLITLGRKGGLENFRRAHALLGDRYGDVTRKLFNEIAPRYADRPGGYTRVLHLPASANRLGDNAPQVIMELLPAEEGASTEAATE